MPSPGTIVATMGMQLKPNETNTSTGVDHKKTLLGLSSLSLYPYLPPWFQVWQTFTRHGMVRTRDWETRSLFGVVWLMFLIKQAFFCWGRLTPLGVATTVTTVKSSINLWNCGLSHFHPNCHQAMMSLHDQAALEKVWLCHGLSRMRNAPR